MELLENMLLQFEDGKVIRIVYNNRLSSIIYAIDMEGNRWAYAIEKDSLVSKHENNEISILTKDPYHRYVDEGDLSDAERARRNRAWDIVMYVFDQLEKNH